MLRKAKAVGTGSERKAVLKTSKLRLSGNPLGIRLSPGIPKKFPFLKIAIGKSKLTGVKAIVTSPLEGGLLVSGKGHLFNKGEKIFRIHVDSFKPGDIVRLLDALKENLPELKKAGFAGFYGFSPNHILLRHFEKKFKNWSPAYIKVPEKEKKWEQKNYLKGIKKRGFSEDYAGQEVKGLALRM